MKRSNGIDLFRFIGAFFIVLLHGSYGELSIDLVEDIRLSTRWAVPFFFICTGYFLNKRVNSPDKCNFQSIEKSIVHLISILIVASIVYLPLDLVKRDFPNDISNVLTGTYFHL